MPGDELVPTPTWSWTARSTCRPTGRGLALVRPARQAPGRLVPAPVGRAAHPAVAGRLRRIDPRCSSTRSATASTTGAAGTPTSTSRSSTRRRARLHVAPRARRPQLGDRARDRRSADGRRCGCGCGWPASADRGWPTASATGSTRSPSPASPPAARTPRERSPARATRSSVSKVPRAGEVHRDAGRGRPPRSPRGRAPSRPAARPRARPRRSAPAARPGTGRTRPTPPTDPAARSPARDTASRHESTRLTCPMPMPTDAPPDGEQDRVRLGRPHRPPGEGQIGQRRRHRRPRRMASVQVDGSSPGASTRSAVCTSRPPEIGRISTGSSSRGAAHEHPQVLLLGPDLEHAVVVGRRDDDLGEDRAQLLGHLDRDRPVGRDHSAVGARPGRTRGPAGAPRRCRRRPRCRTGWRA